MALDRVKISSLIPAQLPEFVRTEYQTFVAFIQAYYDYLDETGVVVDMDTIRDLDESVAEFVEHIKSEDSIRYCEQSFQSTTHS
jgi:cupin superfamily acireductone dioxygenase involved in methionine salvage